MTYKELANFILEKMSEEQRNSDLIIYDLDSDKFYPMHPAAIAFTTKEDKESNYFGNDVLNEGHPYLMF